jgi:hypothetical protein
MHENGWLEGDDLLSGLMPLIGMAPLGGLQVRDAPEDEGV